MIQKYKKYSFDFRWKDTVATYRSTKKRTEEMNSMVETSNYDISKKIMFDKDLYLMRIVYEKYTRNGCFGMKILGY